MKVLIIDDNLEDSKLTEQLLKKNDPEIEIKIENDSTKFFETINPSYDFIILDLNMPKIDGIEILKQMSNSTINVPIIVYSNFIDNYKNTLDKNKIIYLLSKNKKNNEKKEQLASIMINLESYKSCMFVSDKIKTFINNKKNTKMELLDNLNQIKNKLKTIS